MSFLGSLGAGIASFAGSALSGGGISNPLQYYYQRKLMGHEHDYAIEDWNLQNAYNTPKAQMQRYQEAGLNPNLIYGQTNTASPVGSGPHASFNAEGIDLAGFLQKWYSAKASKAQVNNLEQQNENLKSQDSLLGANADYVQAQTRMQELKNKYFQSTGRLPRSEGSLGASVGDFFRYMDWFTPSNKVKGTQVSSHINDKNMFHVWYDSMRKNFERNNRSNGRRESDVTYIKSRL